MKKWFLLVNLYLDGLMHGHIVRHPYWSPFGVWLCCCDQCEGREK